MKILLLGDSTSFTGGFETATYPVYLANKTMWPEGTELINPSVAGTTSADAARYYSEFSKSNPHPELTIIYLGNCDSCSTLYPKGRQSFLGRRKALKGLHSKSKRGQNVMRPFTFDQDFNPLLEQPEDPEDFRFNIQQIIDAAKGSQVVLISPIANKKFIAGSGKGNFIFYRIFGIQPDIWPDLTEVPRELHEGLEAEYEGNSEIADTSYRSLIESDLSESSEVKFIARNNLAVSLAEQGQFDDACELLEMETSLPTLRKEIYFYNLSRIKFRSGTSEDAQKYLEIAYETDRSNYRIRSPYRAILDELKDQDGITLLDLATLQLENSFIDHCHFVEAAQRSLAERLEKLIEPTLQGTSKAKLTTCPVTPEYAFKNDLPLSQFIFEGREGSDEEKEVDKTRITEAAKKHPLFQNGNDIANTPPTLQGELGRYPDAYITRLLAPYLQYAKAEELFMLLDNRTLPVSFDRRLSLLNTDSINFLFNDEHLKIKANPRLIPLIKETILEHLQDYLNSSPTMGYRYRTMMYWYFRESLRYGSHSRPSMLFDQTHLDIIVEAILGLAVMGHKSDQDQSDWCHSVSKLIGDIQNQFEESAELWLDNFNNALPSSENPSLDRSPFLERLEQLS